MDQSLDFSFHKGNPLALADDIESPKPMPSPPVLPVAPADEDTEIPSGQPDKPASSPAVALDVLESLRISPATPVSNEDNAICEASTSLQPITKIAAPIPKLPEEHVSSPKAKPRAKIPYEKGFTQMDWLKRTRTEPDLAGLKGGTNRRLIPLSEVKQHKKEDDAWTVLKGRVYNISPYLKFHPGGVDMLMKGAGKDCTTLFNKYHSWVNAEFLLEKCLVGFLDADQA